MSDELRVSFVDTNILVYALSPHDPQRSPAAERLLKRLSDAGLLRISTQVLQELYVTLTRKSQFLLPPAQALRYVDGIAKSPVALIDFPAIRQAIELSISNQFSFWDALILVCAARSGATRLYTEDLNHGQTVLGVQIVNPFRTP
jgi:predicted nucleic acid-binding protein